MRRFAYLAVFTVVLSLLVNEIMLSAIFQVTVGAFNTIIAISVALLGLSSSGIIAYMMPKDVLLSYAEARRTELVSWFVVATLACTAILMSIPLHHADLAYRGGLAPRLMQFMAYTVAAVPFVAGGICINVFLYAARERVSELYFSDLVGAGIGSLVAALLMQHSGAPMAIVLSTIPAIALIGVATFREARPNRWPLAVMGLLILMVASSHFTSLLEIKRLSSFKSVDEPRYRSFSVEKGDLEFQRWDLDAWTIIRGPEVPQQWEEFGGWGLSRNFVGAVPRLKQINFNARFSTYVTELDGDLSEIAGWLDSDLISLPYLIGRRYATVLNIGAGGGREVLNALHHDAAEITAVDISQATLEEIMRESLSEFSGHLYADPKVRAVVDDGRHFIEQSEHEFDLIDFSIVGGANMVKAEMVGVDRLFTVEALRSYLRHLRPHGVLSYVMYSFDAGVVRAMTGREYLVAQPYIPAPQTLVGLRQVFGEAMDARSFGEHILIAALPDVIAPSLDLVHILFSKSPFSSDERALFQEKCRELGFPVLYPAAVGGDNLYSEIIRPTQATVTEESSRLPILALTDNRPFHFSPGLDGVLEMARKGQLLTFLRSNSITASSMTLGAVAMLFLLLPVLWQVTRADAAPFSPRTWRMLPYFASIGAGYMLVEMSSIFGLQVYFGRPIFALSGVLAIFLLSSGVGSLLSRALTPSSVQKFYRYVTPALFLYAVLYSIFVPRLLSSTIGFSLMERFLVAFLILLPMAFSMGFYFPLGIKMVAGAERSLIPWVWAVNGCMSVVGLFATRVIALVWGINEALVVGMGLYLIAVLCVYGSTRRGAEPLGVPSAGWTL